MVNLTRIYTRTGDAGKTRLGDISETSKTDLRLEAYADVDEANAHLGVALAHGGLDDDVVTVLTRVQNDLFDVGADFCTPVVPNRSTRRCGSSRSTSTGWRRWCDSYNDDLVPKLRSFILNGGTPGAAHLHVARTVVRRAERAAWAAYTEHGDTMNVLAITYLNRLSDLLFILARHANQENGDVLWVPGGERGKLRSSAGSSPVALLASGWLDRFVRTQGEPGGRPQPTRARPARQGAGSDEPLPRREVGAQRADPLDPVAAAHLGPRARGPAVDRGAPGRARRTTSTWSSSRQGSSASSSTATSRDPRSGRTR